MRNNRGNFNSYGRNNFRYTKSTISNSFKKNINIILLIVIFIIIAIITIWYKKEKDVKLTETNTGTFQVYTEAKGYIINSETVVDYNKDETLIPIAESEKRITINSVIGIYKNDEYERGLDQLSKMDEEINKKLEILPEVYSNEVISIDKEIDNLTKQIKNVYSYIQMSDYKTKLDHLAYEKALTISSLTPSGNDVKTLILNRDKYRESMSKSSNNVKAPISGIIIYKNDGLENKFRIKDANKLTNNDIESIMQEFDNLNDETFGIKIVDNYESYIVIKEDKSNDKYIIENRMFTIELLDKGTKIRGLLVKKIDNEKYNYCIFRINNNIEEIVDLRKTDVKVVWRELKGLVVSNSSIKTVNDVDYVTILSLNKYIDIPVKTLLKLEKISLVSNYTREEKEKLEITEKTNLNIYDRVVESKD